MDKAIYALLGVLVGFLLTLAKDLWLEKRKNKKERTLLSIQTSFLLDKFIDGCIDVTFDDGLFHNTSDSFRRLR